MHDFNFFGGGWMMLFWWFLLILLAVIVIRSLMNINRKKQVNETPIEVLERRYANGEIDEEEFRKRKKELME